MRICVCLAADAGYIQHLAVTMASVLKNNKLTDTICFYILASEFTEKEENLLNQLKSIQSFDVHYINVAHEVFAMCPQNTMKHDRMTLATYYRLFIPSLVSKEDRIIYLDCDIVVRTSLAEFYQTSFIENENQRENYLLGVRDIDSRNNRRRMQTRRYVNGGVLLMNLKKMREDNIQQKFIDFIIYERHRILWHDQDVIAAVLDGYVGYVSSKWNGQIGRLPKDMRYSRLNDACILHYIGDRKPWLPFKKSMFTKEYFKYLKLTPFADFEKSFNQKRFWFHLWDSIVFLATLIIKKQSSPRRTYNYWRVLGMPFKRRKRGKKWYKL